MNPTSVEAGAEVGAYRRSSLVGVRCVLSAEKLCTVR